MDQTRKEALLYIIDLCEQLSAVARKHDFEVIAALLVTVVARAKSILSQDIEKPVGPLN